MEYRRKLNKSESERHYFYITHKYRKYFPPSNTKFTLIVNEEPYEVEMDLLKRIWTGGFGYKIKWEMGKEFNIIKESDNTFKLEEVKK